jgi:hypothetical protein
MLKICSFVRAPIRHLLPGVVLAIGAVAACPAAMALTISGKPATAVIAGSAYSFTPTSTVAAGKTRVFKIAYKPSWASFSSTTGRLYGTPTNAVAGYYYHITISVTDGTSTVSLPQFMIDVHTKDTSPPKISGTPPTSVTAGSPYSFHPTATGAPGNSLYFEIKNKPAWATFSMVNGSLTGTPTSAQVGTYGNIQILAVDGQMGGATPLFSITVKPATTTAASTGTATVSWTRPTQNTNGSTLTNLAGYRLHYGTSSSNLSTVVQIPSAATTSYALKNLTAATWYFAITAYTVAGVESAKSQIVSKAVK